MLRIVCRESWDWVVVLEARIFLLSLFKIFCWISKFDQPTDQIKMVQVQNLVRRNRFRLEAWMIYVYQSSWWYSRETLMIKHVCCHFSNCRFTRLNSWPASFWAKRCLHSSWVVRREWFFIDWLENSNSLVVCLDHVRTTSSILSKFWLISLCQASQNLIDTKIEFFFERRGHKFWNSFTSLHLVS